MASVEDIWPDFRARRWPPGWTVEVVGTIDSTNAALLRDTDRPDRSVLVAAYQTAGRGRLDRRWEAPEGANALFSILFRTVPDPPVEPVQRLGLAAVAACRRLAGVEARLKWPNDVIVDDRKLGGILSQRAAHGLVVGLGLNVGWAPEGAVALGADVHPLDVVSAVLADFDRLGPSIDEAYREALATLGRRVRAETPTGDIIGVATGVDPSGALLVDDDRSVTRRIEVGDVIHLRPV